MIALAGLLLSGAASAAGSDKDPKGVAPSTSGSDPGGGKVDNPPPLNATDTRDKPVENVAAVSNKTWEISAGAEYHHLLGAAYYDANAANNNIFYFTVGARWSPSPYDTISVRYGFYQGYLIDQGDSSVRSDDISFSYTRRIPLPAGITLRPSFSMTAPVSYASQLGGLITSPRLSLSIDKRFGKYFSLDGRVAGSYYVQQNSAGGFSYTGAGISEGTYNGLGTNTGGAGGTTIASASLSISAELAMPFHEALSVGVSAFTGWGVRHNPESTVCPPPPGTPSTLCMYGAEMDTTQGQPTSQIYGYEISLHYAFPTIPGGLKTDAFFAWAPLGDPAVGYKSVLNGNGVPAYYGSYFSSNEVYMGINARY
jgi:hypothetical protein